MVSLNKRITRSHILFINSWIPSSSPLHLHSSLKTDTKGANIEQRLEREEPGHLSWSHYLYQCISKLSHSRPSTGDLNNAFNCTWSDYPGLSFATYLAFIIRSTILFASAKDCRAAAASRRWEGIKLLRRYDMPIEPQWTRSHLHLLLPLLLFLQAHHQFYSSSRSHSVYLLRSWNWICALIIPTKCELRRGRGRRRRRP